MNYLEIPNSSVLNQWPLGSDQNQWNLSMFSRSYACQVGAGAAAEWSDLSYQKQLQQ